MSRKDQAELLAGLMDSNGFTQKSLAEASGASQGHISDVLNRKQSLGLKAARKIAPVLKVQPSYLLDADYRNSNNAS